MSCLQSWRIQLSTIRTLTKRTSISASRRSRSWVKAVLERYIFVFFQPKSFWSLWKRSFLRVNVKSWRIANAFNNYSISKSFFFKFIRVNVFAGIWSAFSRGRETVRSEEDVRAVPQQLGQGAQAEGGPEARTAPSPSQSRSLRQILGGRVGNRNSISSKQRYTEYFVPF